MSDWVCTCECMGIFECVCVCTSRLQLARITFNPIFSQFPYLKCISRVFYVLLPRYCFHIEINKSVNLKLLGEVRRDSELIYHSYTLN